jgi:hypothetical protein
MATSKNSPYYLIMCFSQAGPGIVFAVQNGKNHLTVDSLLSGGSAEAQVAEQVRTITYLVPSPVLSYTNLA